MLKHFLLTKCIKAPKFWASQLIVFVHLIMASSFSLMVLLPHIGQRVGGLIRFFRFFNLSLMLLYMILAQNQENPKIEPAAEINYNS